MSEIFSPYMLKTFEQCPERYCFKYIKKISMPVNDEIFITGQNIHALASYYLRNENIDKMESALDEKETELWLKLKSCRYFSYTSIKTEYNLAVKIGRYFFGGRLDALVKNNNKYYILDYKTGSAPKNAQYDYQTMIYLLAVRSFYKTDNIEFVYIDLKNNKETSVELTSKLVNEYENKLTEIADRISAGDFRPSRKDCKNCEYGIICYDKKILN